MENYSDCLTWINIKNYQTKICYYFHKIFNYEKVLKTDKNNPNVFLSIKL
jgi:hypothetical protein